MRNLKRVLTICVAVLLMISALTVVSFAQTTKFTDVRETDETLIKAVSLLEALNVAKGTTDTTFGTNQEVTRQQMAAFIYRLMNAGKTLEGGENFTPFEDLYDDTYFGMISWANSMNIIKGQSANKFDPEGTITLQDAYTMLVRALGYEEKGALSYPHDYIQIAESKEVDLGEGLPAKVKYTSKLTRGNVAILLSNAFYAETAKTVEVEKVRELGKGTEKNKFVLEVVEENVRLCEDIYGVIEETFTVRATTHYAFNDAKDDSTYEPTEDAHGRGSMLLIATESKQKIDKVYTTVGELGLAGKADDYIMADVTLFYTYDNKNEEIKDIIFAQSNLKKATASSASYTNVTAVMEKPEDGATETETCYTIDSGKPSYARMSGDMKVAGNVMYFYDAPYSYVQPSYEGCTTEEDRYAARNIDNTKLINLLCLDAEKGLYSYYVTDDEFLTKDGYGTDKTRAFATKFSQVRSSGIYEMDIFDPDGDGRYEYMWYKPATFAKIVLDDNYKFADNKTVIHEPVENAHPDGLTRMPKLYAYGATFEGEAFNDEDFVVAYVNGDANLVKIFGVAQARKGTVSGYDRYNGYVEIGYQTFRTCYQFRFVENFYPSDSDGWKPSDNNINMYSFFTTASCINREVILYTYNYTYNNVMYYEIVDEENEYTQEDLLIPIERYTQPSRTDINSDYVQYLKVLLNGEEKYIPVNVEKSYPAPKAEGNAYDYGVTVTENGVEYDAYLNKLCTYTVDKNGVYTLTSLLHETKDEAGLTPKHIPFVIDEDFFSKKKVNQAASDFENEGGVYINKVASNRYAIVDSNGNNMLGAAGTRPGEFVDFDNAYVDETTFIIRVVKKNSKGEYENKIVVYDGVAFPGTSTSEFTNVQYIFQNRGTSTTAVDLVIFYGEVWDADLEFESKITDTAYVIVKNSQVKKVSADEFRYTYDVFNPATGELQTGVLGTGVGETAKELTDDVTPYEAGAVIKVTSSGKIDDEKAVGERNHIVLFDGNPADKKLAYIKDVFLSENLVDLAPINSTDNEYYKWGATREGAFDLHELAEDVTVTVLKFGKTNNLKTAEMSVLTLEEFAAMGKDLKCYTTSYIAPEDADDPTAEFSTEYCKYVKAFVTATYKSRYDYPIIDSIIVVVHPDQTAELDVD